MFIFSLVFLLLFIANIQTVSGVFTGDLHGNTYINEDGSIEPPNAPIQRNGEIYTLTDNFYGAHLRVERSNIIVDGNGFTLYQNLMLHHVTSVTIKNFIINNEGTGIDMDYSPNNIITNNTISGCGSESESMGTLGAAMFIHGGDSNLVYGNNIKNNLIGVIVIGSPHTIFYGNNFEQNIFDVREFGGLGFGPVPSIALFDNGETGNFWSKYHGNDNNGDGIGDNPYIIDENNQDYYPLMNQFIIPEFSSWIILPLFLIITLFGIILRKKFRVL
jgi:parallel beta-helix repeat protein